MTAQGVFSFLRDKGVYANQEWVNQCLSHLRTKGPLGATTQAASEQVFGVYLQADIHGTVNLVPQNKKEAAGGQDGLLPGDLGSKHKVSLSPSKPIILQIDEISNVGASLDHQQQHSKRFLKLFLTDGINSVVGLEHRTVEGLHRSLPAGTKVSIKNAPMRHGAILLSPYCVTVLGGEVSRLVDLDKQYAPAEPDEELRGPAQQAANGGGGGSGAMAPGAQPVRVRGPPVPPAHRGRQHEQQGQGHGQEGDLDLAAGEEESKDWEAMDVNVVDQQDKGKEKEKKDGNEVVPAEAAMSPQVFDLTNSAPNSPRASQSQGKSRSPSPSPEVDYDAWVHDDGFYDDYGYGGSPEMHQEEQVMDQEQASPAREEDEALPAPSSGTNEKEGGEIGMEIEDDTLLGSPPAAGSEPALVEEKGSPSKVVTKLPPVPLSLLSSLTVAPPSSVDLESTDAPTIYLRGHCSGVKRFKIVKKKKAKGAEGGKSQKSQSPGKSQGAPEFEIYVDVEDGVESRKLRLSSALCERHLGMTPQAYQDQQSGLNELAAREAKTTTLMKFAYLKGIFHCRWRKVGSKNKKRSKSADVSLDGSTVAAGDSQDGSGVELEIYDWVSDPRHVMSIVQGNLHRGRS